MNWKIGAAAAATAAAVGVATFAWPAGAEGMDAATTLHVPGDRDQIMGCVAWQDDKGSNLACGDGWRFAGQWLTFEDGTRSSGGGDGPGGDYQLLGWTGCEHPGVTKVTFAVGDLNTKNGWEGRGSYSCP
jgi:hypothetical protein